MLPSGLLRVFLPLPLPKRLAASPTSALLTSWRKESAYEPIFAVRCSSFFFFSRSNGCNYMYIEDKRPSYSSLFFFFLYCVGLQSARVVLPSAHLPSPSAGSSRQGRGPQAGRWQARRSSRRCSLLPMESQGSQGKEGGQGQVKNSISSSTVQSELGWA